MHALTTPLLTKADGTKFGKTEGGTVWLDPELTSPYAFFQFWLNADDRDVPALLRTFSFRTQTRSTSWRRRPRSGRRPGRRQRALAEELTALVHGAEEAGASRQPAARCSAGASWRPCRPSTLAAALHEVPHVSRRRRARCRQSSTCWPPPGLVASKSAARRAVAEGGAYLNNDRVTDDDAAPATADLLHGRLLVLRRGQSARVGGVARRADRSVPGRQGRDRLAWQGLFFARSDWRATPPAGAADEPDCDAAAVGCLDSALRPRERTDAGTWRTVPGSRLAKAGSPVWIAGGVTGSSSKVAPRTAGKVRSRCASDP